MTKRY